MREYMNNPKIRKASLEDASRIAEILIFAKRSTYRSIFQDDKVSFGKMQVLPLALEYLHKPDLLDGMIVFDDEFVKGVVNIRRCFTEDGVVAVQLLELYIEPFFWHKGIGGELLLEVESDMKRNHVNHIFLWVLEKNKNARCFYEKHGFQPTEEKKLEEGTSEYIMKYVKIMSD